MCMRVYVYVYVRERERDANYENMLKNSSFAKRRNAGNGEVLKNMIEVLYSSHYSEHTCLLIVR